MTDDDRRKLWRAHVEAGRRVDAENNRRHERFLEGNGAVPFEGLLPSPSLPPELRGLACGAKTRKGRPCVRTDLYGPSARCKYHGGASTGPKTEDGRQRARANLALRWARRDSASEPHEGLIKLEVAAGSPDLASNPLPASATAKAGKSDHQAAGMTSDDIARLVALTAAKVRAR